MKIIPSILFLLIIFSLIGTILYYNQSPTDVENGTFNLESLSPDKKKDLEYRTTIATSYCGILKKQGKVAIENFNACLTEKIERPLDIYKALTGKQLSKGWDSLALTEKELVVEEVLVAEEDYYSAEKSRKSQESLNAWYKSLDEYSECQLEMSSKSEAWLKLQCPETQNFFSNMNCRSDAMESAEYQNLYGCKSPY
jgi:hypothetical protein